MCRKNSSIIPHLLGGGAPPQSRYPQHIGGYRAVEAFLRRGAAPEAVIPASEVIHETLIEILIVIHIIR